MNTIQAHNPDEVMRLYFVRNYRGRDRVLLLSFAEAKRLAFEGYVISYAGGAQLKGGGV